MRFSLRSNKPEKHSRSLFLHCINYKRKTHNEGGGESKNFTGNANAKPYVA